MGTPRRAVVLSDIHLGPEGPLATFRDDAALAAYLWRLEEESVASPTELVLAGDCFDFLQTEGYDGFDPTRAVERFESILKAPHVARVFEALRRFASRPGNEITLLAGNHDPEMLLDDVRRRFEDEIRRRGTVLHADDVPLRHAEGERPPVWGRALAGGAVWVVHGDRWDPANMIHRDEVRAAVREGRPVKLPAGSHFVFEIMRHIKPLHLWIDELKPEMPTVLLLLYYLAPKLLAQFLRSHYGLTALLVLSKVEARLASGSLFGPEIKGAPTDVPDRFAYLIADALRKVPEAERPQLLAQLDARLRGDPPPAGGTFASHGGLDKLVVRAWLARVREADRFQDPGEPDDVFDAAKPFLPNDLPTLIAGHTHGARARTASRPAYFNTGTWIPVGQIPPGPLEDRIDELEKGPTWPAEAPRTFVQVDLVDGPPLVRLFACDRDGTPREVRDA
jgi:UDP-2,3-diacylglucosamine pyrophosphatase LpxH